jgi:superfamily II DNA or RNA helicase
MSYDIELEHKSEAVIHIKTSDYILKEIDRYFRYKDESFQLKCAVNPKMRYWSDGYYYLLDKRGRTLPFSLYTDLLKFAKENNYTVNFPNSIISRKQKFTDDEIQEIISSYNLPLEPRDYQISSFKRAIEDKRIVWKIPTGSGKSFGCYLVTRYIYDNDKNKILIIVPNKGLVNQLKKDFIEYGSPFETHIIYSGQEKDSDNHRVYISTWQSLYKEDKKYFDKFCALIIDECHSNSVSSSSLKTLSNKCNNAYYRIGMTGTTRKEIYNIKLIEGTLGPIYAPITTKQLQDRNLAAKINISIIKLEYPESVTAQINRLDWQQHLNFVENVQNPRQKYIIDLANSLTGVTLVLFRKIEHGVYLFDELLKSSIKEKIFFIDGSVSGEDRTKYTTEIGSNSEDAIIVASYGTFSTGINLPRIKTLIFASGVGKSEIRCLQSLGRALRKHVEKEKTGARILDISDNLKYSEKHLSKRLEIYRKEQFPFKIIHQNLADWIEKHKN